MVTLRYIFFNIKNKCANVNKFSIIKKKFYYELKI